MHLLAILLIVAAPVQPISFLPFLNFSSPSPYIFHSLATLLQTYPQTLFPNGHSIAAVTIPRNTLLYHGRHDNDTVPSPEWLAFDVEMAYGIMGSMRDSRMLTYRTTKDIKALYFDGTSANLMGEGTMSQMVLLYNGTENIPRRGGWGRPPGKEDEYLRARGLCKWLRDHGHFRYPISGYEAVVRMNAGFELIWCDFDSPSLKLISNLNVSAPLLDASTLNMPASKYSTSSRLSTQARFKLNDEGPHGPGLTDPREPFRNTVNWFWFAAAAKRYFREPRIKLKTCGLFSFYEPQIHAQSFTRLEEERNRLNLTVDGQWQMPLEVGAKDAALDKLMKRRRQHYLSNVSEKDAFSMFLTLKRRLPDAQFYTCTGVDWQYIAQDIVTRYSDAIQNLQQAVNIDFLDWLDWDSLRNWMQSTRALTHWFLIPFLEYPLDIPRDEKTLKAIFSQDSNLAKWTLDRCVNQYNIDEHNIHDDDNFISIAANETLAGICSTVVIIGLSVEYYWLLNFNGETPDGEDQRRIHRNIIGVAQIWKDKIEELMAWLGWADKWITCEDPCGIGEICYIPMWPVSGYPRRRPSVPADTGEKIAPPHFDWGSWDKFLWEPVCVNATSYPPEQWDVLV
ncbi:hypothetical protein CC78DRAFT_512036 [Lojkania enalia]|uniref:Uncharacterized protein n=1 Tax=Lojkania enalia TaxID=147567 RepID=A0A9P4N8Z7_9PLEO|nr:hypothetical protein CC78DRAFT_512036 [Didymosphaeria enalia]